MYRNSKDKRVKQSADQLFRAIKTLLTSKDFDDIGIKEISNIAGVDRTTFYRNFDYVEDILRFKLDQAFDLLRNEVELHMENDPVVLPLFFKFWVNNSEILQVLIAANRWNIFLTRFSEGADSKMLEITEDMQLDDSHREYLSAAMRSLFTAVLHTWIARGKVENADELMGMFKMPFRVFAARQAQI